MTYRWHAAHQYELFKSGHQFTLVTGGGTLLCDQWDYGQRPLPHNVQFKPLHAINASEYDFAILPFDENILDPECCGNMLSLDYGAPRRYGDFLGDSAPVPENAEEIIPAKREALRELINDIHVVCNSHQALREWRFHKSSVIWHGFSPDEFPSGTHEKTCLTLPAQAFAARSLYRGKACLDRAADLLAGICPVHYTAPPLPHTPATVRKARNGPLSSSSIMPAISGNSPST